MCYSALDALRSCVHWLQTLYTKVGVEGATASPVAASELHQGLQHTRAAVTEALQRLLESHDAPSAPTATTGRHHNPKHRYTAGTTTTSAAAAATSFQDAANATPAPPPPPPAASAGAAQRQGHALVVAEEEWNPLTLQTGFDHLSALMQLQMHPLALALDNLRFKHESALLFKYRRKSRNKPHRAGQGSARSLRFRRAPHSGQAAVPLPRLVDTMQVSVR